MVARHNNVVGLSGSYGTNPRDLKKSPFDADLHDREIVSTWKTSLLNLFARMTVRDLFHCSKPHQM